MESGASLGGTGKVEVLDVTDRQMVQACAASGPEQFGKIDILVNNAGGVVGQVHQPVETVAYEEWQRVVDVNLTGAFFCIQAVAPGMKENRGLRCPHLRRHQGDVQSGSKELTERRK